MNEKHLPDTSRSTPLRLCLFTVCASILFLGLYFLWLESIALPNHRKRFGEREHQLKQFLQDFVHATRRDPDLMTSRFIEQNPQFGIDLILESDNPEAGKAVVLCEHYGRSHPATPILIEYFPNLPGAGTHNGNINCFIVERNQGIRYTSVRKRLIPEMYDTASRDPTLFFTYNFFGE